jgi:hypothetical protein
MNSTTRRTGLSCSRLSAPNLAFVVATCCTNSLFFDVCSPGAFLFASIAGLMRCNSWVSLPSSAPSMAPLTAPHSLWPSTTISFAPASLVANSALPMMSSSMMLPAMRALKMSPIRRSKTSSGGYCQVGKGVGPMAGSQA